MGRHAAHKSIWFRYVSVLNDATANTAAAAAIDITELSGLHHAGHDDATAQCIVNVKPLPATDRR